MFGLFKKKPTEADFEQAKIDGSVYPGESISVLQIQTESNQMGTAWINKNYKDYRFKEFCPYFLAIKVDLSNLDETQQEELDMSTIEDFFDEKLKSIGISHFIARFVTDKGMDMLFYTEANPQIELTINNLMNENDLGLDFDVEMNEFDSKWNSMKMVLA